MKHHFTLIKQYGPVLLCCWALSSCSALQCVVDQNKIHQLDQDYQDGKISKKSYKREKRRLQIEIQANQQMTGELMAGTYVSPEDASQAEYATEPAPYESVDEPYYVYENIYYYQHGGQYYHTEHGHRVYVKSLPAGGRRGNRSDANHLGHSNISAPRSAPQQTQSGTVPRQIQGRPAPQQIQRGSVPQQSQARPTAPVASGQQSTSPKNGQTSKDDAQHH